MPGAYEHEAWIELMGAEFRVTTTFDVTSWGYRGDMYEPPSGPEWEAESITLSLDGEGPEWKIDYRTRQWGVIVNKVASEIDEMVARMSPPGRAGRYRGRSYWDDYEAA